MSIKKVVFQHSVKSATCSMDSCAGWNIWMCIHMFIHYIIKESSLLYDHVSFKIGDIFLETSSVHFT